MCCPAMEQILTLHPQKKRYATFHAFYIGDALKIKVLNAKTWSDSALFSSHLIADFLFPYVKKDGKHCKIKRTSFWLFTTLTTLIN